MDWVSVMDGLPRYLPPVLNTIGGFPPQTIIWLPVQTAVCRSRAVGALVVLVAVQLFVMGCIFPPVFNAGVIPLPPQHDHFAASPDCGVPISRSEALLVLVAVQLFVLGLYFPPSLKTVVPGIIVNPPHTIISVPVQTAV